MTKDKALKMAIEQMNIYAHMYLCEHQCEDEELLDVINACKEALETPVCNPHPLAPHGFNRNGSHNAGRYVCDCEGWEFEWQGLTDNEKLKSIRKWSENNTMRGIELIGLCDAIEQALKEKNHG